MPGAGIKEGVAPRGGLLYRAVLPLKVGIRLRRHSLVDVVAEVDDEIQIPPAGDIAVRRIVARLPVLAGGEGELQAVRFGVRSLEVAYRAFLAFWGCGWEGVVTYIYKRELVRVLCPRLQPTYFVVYRVAEPCLRNGILRDRHRLAGIGSLDLPGQRQVLLPGQRVALHLHEFIQARLLIGISRGQHKCVARRQPRPQDDAHL